MALATIEESIEEIRRGRMVILMDDKDRENEGDLCMAAEKVTPQAINFMATHGRGLICLSLTEERVRYLGLSMMVSENTSPFGTAFTVSIDATSGPYFPPPGQKGRRVSEGRSDRRFRGPSPTGWA
jgi:3,4-dihydroxy 2-butanone 4-phosphate synthase / GTP cyclohydrolase II